MNRINRNYNQTKPKEGPKEHPNWGIRALYNDRQLIRDKKLTKYFIPFDSTNPDKSWHLFIFRDDENEEEFEMTSPTILIGREKFCDIILKDATVSRQHCAIQFRLTKASESEPKLITKPYIFDMSSKGGTFINENVVPPMCFIELKPSDTISFAKSSENIVVMQLEVHEEVNYDE
ncbi:FHA domain containing protein [Tritrichomonas foetus]|uniref:FHA domain containing protein n=1 Tax=Tritrichomonas foetus TaxID=1144522 RepID=A0A1J4JN03_9EUKA|nr:FHA domain containing protein [Tritrichomonas foetus]|eukprot:OHS99815.1 FHA domain containing protein [Tritrichomonas foetus]